MNSSNKTIKNTLTTAVLGLSLLVQGCKPTELSGVVVGKPELINLVQGCGDYNPEVSGIVVGEPELKDINFNHIYLANPPHFQALRFPVRTDSGKLIEYLAEVETWGAESTALKHLKKEIKVGDRVIIPEYYTAENNRFGLVRFNPNYPKIIKKGETK